MEDAGVHLAEALVKVDNSVSQLERVLIKDFRKAAEIWIIMCIAHPLVHGEVCSGCKQPAVPKLPLVDVEPDQITVIL